MLLQIGASLCYKFRQLCYKLRQALSQIGADFLLLTWVSVITNWGSYCKWRQNLLQTGTGITN